MFAILVLVLNNLQYSTQRIIFYSYFSQVFDWDRGVGTVLAVLKLIDRHQYLFLAWYLLYQSLSICKIQFMPQSGLERQTSLIHNNDINSQKYLIQAFTKLSAIWKIRFATSTILRQIFPPNVISLIVILGYTLPLNIVLEHSITNDTCKIARNVMPRLNIIYPPLMWKTSWNYKEHLHSRPICQKYLANLSLIPSTVFKYECQPYQCPLKYPKKGWLQLEKA